MEEGEEARCRSSLTDAHHKVPWLAAQGRSGISGGHLSREPHVDVNRQRGMLVLGWGTSEACNSPSIYGLCAEIRVLLPFINCRGSERSAYGPP